MINRGVYGMNFAVDGDPTIPELKWEYGLLPKSFADSLRRRLPILPARTHAQPATSWIQVMRAAWTALLCFAYLGKGGMFILRVP